MTSIEYLLEMIRLNDKEFYAMLFDDKVIDQAKEMHKQEIIDAHLDGQSLVSCKDEYAEQYYNQTFKKD